MMILTLSAACHRVYAPANIVNVADPVTSVQLLSGFYGVEGNSWRWTARRFSVVLGPPRRAAKVGGKLTLHLYIPDVQIRDLGPMTLDAEVAGLPLLSQTFSKEGVYEYVREIPASTLDTNLVPIDFSFDKWSGPLEGRSHELGAVVTSIALEAK